VLHPDAIVSPTLFTARGRRIPTDDTPMLMGVLNVTPDSFSDGGRYLDPAAAVAHALAMVEQGADLIDIGAESSRPGAAPVDEQEELRRLIPVVKAVCRETTIPVSVDTTKATVARRALEAGASIVNDISALRWDPGMAQAVAQARAGLVLVHMQGRPATMQRAPQYGDVVEQVRAFLSERLQAAMTAGIEREQIVLDPGLGFGKTPEHNLLLLRRLDAFLTLGRPILVGASRKAFIGAVVDRPVDERLMGTVAAVVVAILRGARIVRVHDVGALRDVVKMVQAIRRA
jgi:dihydropteroate synthase